MENQVQQKTEKTKERPRLVYVDQLRFLACFLVILTHSVMPTDDASMGVFLAALAFMGSPSSELFLSLSGAVLLPTKVGFRDFYKRRFMKLIPPVLFWSSIVLIYYFCIGRISSAELIKKFLYIPFEPVHGVYWFVYVMIGLYFLAPFISPWLKNSSRRQVELFLGLWMINMFLPWVKFFITDLAPNLNTHYWELNPFAGFLGYWLTGYYLKKYPIKISINFRWLLILFGSIAYIAGAFLLKIMDIAPLDQTTDNTQIGSVFLVGMLYTLAQNITLPNKIQTIVTEVAKMSFGIYLTHVLIVKELMWEVVGPLNLHPLASSFLIASCTMAICFTIVKLLSKLPFSKYTVGL